MIYTIKEKSGCCENCQNNDGVCSNSQAILKNGEKYVVLKDASKELAEEVCKLLNIASETRKYKSIIR